MTAIILAAQLCKEFEGFHKVVARRPIILAAPYLCPANYWTIGYGHLCSKNHPAISLEEGEALLQRDLAVAWGAALRQCPTLATQSAGRQAAIVDFVFNLGEGRLRSSTLRKRIAANRWDLVPTELRKWIWGGGRKLPGLIRRREAEISLLYSPPRTARG
jgi:lysozyme